jgi:hypothetical protein
MPREQSRSFLLAREISNAVGLRKHFASGPQRCHERGDGSLRALPHARATGRSIERPRSVWIDACTGNDAMIARVRLVLCDTDTSLAALALDELLVEFPSLEIGITRERRAAGDVTIDAADWRGPSCDLSAFDRRLSALAQGQCTLDIRTPTRPAADTAIEVLTRYQRFIPRANAASRSVLFERILERHRALHDVSKALVRADYDHALDVWHWTLRLDPHAGFASQVAALFHDAERLATEADGRIAHLAPDYGTIKEAHAPSGAALTASVLAAVGVDPSTRAEIARLIEAHEGPAHRERTRDLTLLADADALSFFALNSPGFVDSYGLPVAKKKIAHTVSRMSPRGRSYLTRIRLRNDVARALSEAIASEPRIRVPARAAS